MGEVKDTVKGNGLKDKPSKVLTGDNLIEHVTAIMEEVSHCIQVKDEDTLKESELEKAENTRKAGILRAVHSMLVSSKNLLEDY